MAIININDVNIQKLTLNDLISDATDRGDKAALLWLMEEAKKKVSRTGKDGKTKEVYKPVNMYRMAYLETFCGYEKKKAVGMTADQRRQNMLGKLFDDAFAKIAEADDQTADA